MNLTASSASPRTDDGQEATANWLERLTVAGAAARGLVYLVIGGTALRAIAYTSAQTRTFPGAFKTITTAPLGRVLLVFVAAGLAAFAISRVLEAILVLRSRAREAWLAQSIGLIRALVYGVIAFLALRIALRPSRDQEGRASEWAAFAIVQPLGRWLLGLIGLVVIGLGVYQFVRAFQRHRLPLWAFALAFYGRSIYALLVLLLGAFALSAGIFRSPGEARGLGGTLSFLQERLFGPSLLAIFGCGMIVHGVMSAIEVVRRSHETAAEET